MPRKNICPMDSKAKTPGQKTGQTSKNGYQGKCLPRSHLQGVCRVPESATPIAIKSSFRRTRFDGKTLTLEFGGNIRPLEYEDFQEVARVCTPLEWQAVRLALISPGAWVDVT